MIMSAKIVFVYFTLITITFAAVLPLKDFKECQRNYNEKIGELVATFGMSAAATMGRILFEDFDLNRHKIVGTSDLVLKLNEENLVTSANMKTLFDEAQAWIDSAHPQDGNHELNVNKFIDIVRESIARVENNPRSHKYGIEITEAVCEYLTGHMPRVISTMRNLSNCVSTIKSEQLQTLSASGSARLTINTWKGVFLSIDGDGDKLVSFAEVFDALQLNGFDMKENSSEVIRKLQSYLPHDNMTQSNFLKAVTSLLFGFEDEKVWENITTLGELQGKLHFCEALRETRIGVRAGLRESEECITLYKETLASVLHHDSSIAPAYIFSVIDKNKDGVIKSQLMHPLIPDASFTLETFQKFLPDQVVAVKNRENDDSVELSVLSNDYLQVWGAFCMTAVEALVGFPKSVTGSQLSDADLIAELGRRLLASQANGDYHIIEAFDNLLESFPTPNEGASTSETSLATTRITVEDAAGSETIAKATEKPQANSSHLEKAVDDVMTNLEKSNGTRSEAEKLEDLVKKVNSTKSQNEESVLSTEERELWELIEHYRDDINAVQESPNDETVYSDDVTTSDLARNEALIERMLKQAIIN